MMTRRKAFTVIEMVVALAIILLLVGMVTVAVTKVLDSSRNTSTKVFLQTGVSFFEEWRKGERVEYPTHAWTGSVVPGDIKEGGADRNGLGVALTRGTMYRLAQSSAAKRLMTNMPQDRWLALADPSMTTWPSSLPDPVNVGQKLRGMYNQRNASDIQRFFICYNPSAAAKAPTGADPATWDQDWKKYWFESITGDINVLSDSWKNPVLFVPACGFEAADLNGNSVLVTSDGIKPSSAFHPSGSNFLARLTWASGKSYIKGQIVMSLLEDAKKQSQWGLFVCSANHTANAGNRPDTAQGGNNWDRLPVEPFFASAGPDGILFAPGNPKSLLDNLYSFER